jgi:hypothetical protein
MWGKELSIFSIAIDIVHAVFIQMTYKLMISPFKTSRCADCALSFGGVFFEWEEWKGGYGNRPISSG